MRFVVPTTPEWESFQKSMEFAASLFERDLIDDGADLLKSAVTEYVNQTGNGKAISVAQNLFQRTFDEAQVQRSREKAWAHLRQFERTHKLGQFGDRPKDPFRLSQKLVISSVKPKNKRTPIVKTRAPIQRNPM